MDLHDARVLRQYEVEALTPTNGHALIPVAAAPMRSGFLSHACPFSDAQGMIRFLRGNVRRGKDNIAISEGPTGSGKSTTSGQVARRLDPTYDPVADAIFDLGHLLDVLEDARPERVVKIDEGINIFHNQDWSTWQAKALTRILRQMRVIKSTWLIDVQDFAGLHPYLRDYGSQLRWFHQPWFDSDGMGNGPPMTLWRRLWFDYKANVVSTRWQDLEFDLLIDSLDNEPFFEEYHQKKLDNYHRLIGEFRSRMADEEARANRPHRGKGRKTKVKPTPPPTTT